MDIVYAMPKQPHRLFINVVHACPNACLFCVDFKGATFYGFDLKRGQSATADEIVAAIRHYPGGKHVREIYFCGIGEPLLLYDRVVESAARVRDIMRPGTVLALNTSGTFYLWNKRVDFVTHFDLIQISLNAESEDKYNQICRPKVPGAYNAVLEFLGDLRAFLDRSASACKVELTVVNPVDVTFLPERERKQAHVPSPDIEACRAIAASFGWPLKVKRLIQDCELPDWVRFADRIRTPSRIGPREQCVAGLQRARGEGIL